MADCCTVISVVGSTALTAPTTDPVVLTLDAPVPTGCSFSLCIPKSFLVNSSTNLVTLVNGADTYTLIDGATALQVRWDQLVLAGWRVCPCEVIKLRCKVRTQATPLTVVVSSDLPDTSYLTVPTA